MGNSQGKPISFSDEVNLSHFRLLRVVGKGAFGKVRIVERKDTQLTFALKYIRKDEVVRSESVRNIIRERRMLESISHPFICNLRYSFQDIEYMYLVVDLMSGGDLRFHISRKTFTEEAVRFWIAELGCALKYVHKQGIIHRDVKPDNVLLDFEGHIHLADFNVASDFTPGKQLTSKSGTLAYLAPEVYKGTGYSSGADWWSLGVLFYECIYNKRPFEGSSQSSLGELIMKASPNFPVTAPPVSMPCLHAISSALEVDPSKRMGSITFHSFTDNPFFRDIDFDALQRKEIEPIFVPSSDKTNFDATYDLEELLLEEAPLEARARKQKPREQLKDDATEKEIKEEELYKMIERDFVSFDYNMAAFKGMALQKTNSRTPTSAAETPGDSPAKAVSIKSTRKGKQTKSQPSSPTGSPPANPFAPPLPNGKYSRNTSPAPPGDRRPVTNFSTPHSRPPQPSFQQSYQQPANYPRTHRPGGMRSESVGGGVQVVLGETGSWSELATHDATLPADAKLINESSGKSGMLGFLSRKKGRGNSPKPMERGILGKEGARVIISNGN